MAGPFDYPQLARQRPRRGLVETTVAHQLVSEAYANTLAHSREAAEARQANEVGRKLGLPGATVSADLPGFREEANNQSLVNTLAGDPALARFMGDPQNAASVKDDVPALSEMSAILKLDDDNPNVLLNRMKKPQGRSLLNSFGIKPPTNRYSFDSLPQRDLRNAPDFPEETPVRRVSNLEGGFWTAVSSIGAADRGIQEYVADAFGYSDTLHQSERYQRFTAGVQRAEELANAPSIQQEREGKWLSARMYNATQSLELMGMAVLTKKPIAAMGLQVGAQQYGDVRARGATANEALFSGAVTGGAESFFERYFGLGWILGNFGKKATSKFIGGLLLREVPSEMATTAVQDLADAMVTGGGGWEGYKAELPADLLNTAASTALMVGMLGGPHYLAHRLRPQAQAVQEIERAGAEGEFLDRLAAAAEKSKVKKEDPETLRDFIDQRTEGSPARNVYVPVEAVAKYMQSDEYKGELDRYEPQITEAQATQGDVVIPASDAVAYLAGTPAWEALKEDMRVSPGGLSRNEAKLQHDEIIRTLEQRGKEIAAEAEQTNVAVSDGAQVYQEVKNRLRTGGIDEKQADAIAQIYAARYEARASRMGGTATEQFKNAKIVFPGESAEQAGRQFGQETPLEGMPQDVKVGDRVVHFGPFAPARAAAARVAAAMGREHAPPTTYAKVDVERGARIAQAFEDMQHNPEDPQTKAAYRAMIDETIAQYKELMKTGLKVEFIEGDDPYGNPRNATLDVIINNHLWVFPTDAGFGSSNADVSGNPLLEIVPDIKISGKPVRANDLFRVVHDYFGHIMEGVGFRAEGEENAWRIHSAMFSPLARRAMTTETRGQNSWVNFGPHGEANRKASTADTVFADQKIGLLPEWVSEEGLADDRALNQDAVLLGWQGLSEYLTDEEKAKLREDSKAKILSLVETLPKAEEMAAAATAGRAKRGWYESSAHAILQVFGAADAPRFAALLAATSPQVSVELNLYNALSIWTKWNDADRPTSRAEIVAIMGQSVAGKRGSGSVLTAWINNSFAALSAADPTQIKLSGPKVDSFMQNLVGAVDEVTNDTWMAMYAGIEQTAFQGRGKDVLGKSPGYKAMNAVIRRAADILTEKTGETWTPAEVQEAVWSFAKTLYETRDRNPTVTMRQLLEAGHIRHENIANTPDFAVLFSDGIFRAILEKGGYGEQAAALERRGRTADVAGEEPVTQAEGTGFTQSDFSAFLNQAAARLEQVRDRRLMASAMRRDDPRQRQLFQDVLPEVGWTPERVSGLLDQFGQEDGSSSAVAVLMTPDEFLRLNASARGREAIAERVDQLEEYGGALDLVKLNESGPIYLGIKLGGEPSAWQKANNAAPPNMVFGHSGRHRMTLLKKAGVERYPVVVEIIQPDGSRASVKEPVQLSNILPNRSRSDQTANGDLSDFELYGIPISWRFKEQLSDMTERELHQSRGEGPRGTTTITDSGQRIIQLFGTANRSTLLHETGHIWLEELKEDGGADWETVQKWFASNGARVSSTGFIPTQGHELFARGFERYLMEGKAPSTSLRGVFTTFKAWLLRIYGVVQNLQSPITPEIREVFDRLIATDEAIADARNSNATEPLFKTAEEAGMTAAEFADYQTRVSDARDEAYDALLFKTMEKLRREKTSEMRDARSAARDEAAQEVNSQPQFRLLHLLRTGRWLGEPEREPARVKLNTGWLIDNFGEGVLDRLPRGIKIIAADGENGDTIAEMVGMESGTQVVHALIGQRAASDELRARGETRSLRDLMIDTAVDDRMADRFGDALRDGTIEEEAIAAINTARQGEIIASEARQLAKRKSLVGVPTPYEFAREWAKRTIAAGHVRDVAGRAALQRYTRAANKAARAAEKAILDGDIDEAYRQKQAQLLNHALLAEAKAAADRVDKIVARMQKLGKRAGMKSVDPEYLGKIHMLLESYDFRPRTQRSIDEQQGFEEWVLRQRERGYEVHIPSRLENRGDPYTRVSVQELESLNDVVESLLALGRAKQKLTVAKAERDFGEFRDEVLARLEKLKTRNMRERWWHKGKLTRAPINEEERKLAAAASELLKVETIVEEMDGGKTGPLHDAIIVGATDAENRRFTLRERVLKPIAEMYNRLGRKQWSRLQARVTIPELTWNTLNEGDPRIGQNVTITRMELLSVLMNMGNISNLEKLSKGERWPVETLRTVMSRELNKEDFDFAQKLWDQVETLWPDIVATERQMAGVVPEKVVAVPIETPYGTYRGGYWPVVYDAARWQRAEDLEGKELDDMFGLKSGVATQKGHTISRTGAYGPINLSIENVLFRHIEQVVTRIAFADYARDVLKIVRDTSIRGMMDTKLGPEYRKQFEKWLARQVHEGATHAKAARWWDGLLRQLRANMTIAAMGLRVSTGVAQTLGLTASADRIGAKWVGLGLKRVALSPRESTAFAFSRSPELLHRAEAVNRETAELSLKMRQKHSWWSGMQHWAMFHIGLIDRYAVALPTWIGAHAKAMSEGMTDEEASAQADKEVRQSQGSGREKDLSAFQSPNSEAMRFFSMFYTPWNVLFNAQWQAARDLRRGDPRRAMSVTFWWLTVSMLGDAMLSGDWPDDDEVETWVKWAGRNIAFGLFSGIPLVRDFTNAAERKVAGQYSDYSQTPVTRVYDAIDKAWKAGKKVKEGEEVAHPIKTTGDLTATLLGVPTSQPGSTAQFLWDVHEGDQDPRSVSDWYFGLTKGKVPTHKDQEPESSRP